MYRKKESTDPPEVGSATPEVTAASARAPGSRCAAVPPEVASAAPEVTAASARARGSRRALSETPLTSATPAAVSAGAAPGVGPVPVPVSGLLVGALNVQSLKQKILELTQELHHHGNDVMLLSETWLKPSTPSRLITLPGYNLVRADRPDGRGYGGGSSADKGRYHCIPAERAHQWCPGQ